MRQAALVGLVLLLFTPTVWLAAFSPQTPSQPRVLILGDSISIGYTPIVKELLQGEAAVFRPMRNETAAENCEGTTKGVEAIDRWLQIDDGRWDVIHFNFGLHDLKRVDPETRQNSNDPAHPRQAEPDVYERNLRAIVTTLQATGAKLVFATTTPYPEGVRPRRDVADAERYNTVARGIMSEHGIPVNDLHALVLPRLSDLQQPVNVHFTPDGSRVMAEAVVVAIRSQLGTRR